MLLYPGLDFPKPHSPACYHLRNNAKQTQRFKMRAQEMISASYPDTGLQQRTNSVGSPPSESIWSTERRLVEKKPPGAPRKSPSSRKRSHDRLLLPSSTIDEEDENPTVSLSFRPTRLSFGSSSSVVDPTTVILAPSHLPTSYSWLEDDEDEAVVSPRLFFGQAKLAQFEAVMVAEDDESDTIFRPREDDGETEPEMEHQTRCPFSPTFRDGDDDRD